MGRMRLHITDLTKHISAMTVDVPESSSVVDSRKGHALRSCHASSGAGERLALSRAMGDTGGQRNPCGLRHILCIVGRLYSPSLRRVVREMTPGGLQFCFDRGGPSHADLA